MNKKEYRIYCQKIARLLELYYAVDAGIGDPSMPYHLALKLRETREQIDRELADTIGQIRARFSATIISDIPF